jgi:hypothetical protein
MLELYREIPLSPFAKGGTQGLIFIVHGCRPGMTITVKSPLPPFGKGGLGGFQ